ncbi:hypothetical protein T484DRAFT_1861198 [Baffinella frigidus]|nr:hypothetical protein T484DRAFT_1861198 [Cryptophyta sp. CCMP2293]
MDSESSVEPIASLHRTILSIIRTEMLRGTKNTGGFTAAAVRKLLQHANSEEHKSASTEMINAALVSLTLWGSRNATLVANGTKFKALSTVQAPPLEKSGSDIPMEMLGSELVATEQLAEAPAPSVDQNVPSENAAARPDEPPDYINAAAPLPESTASEDAMASADDNALSTGEDNTETPLTDAPASEAVRKAQLRFHSQASATLELYTAARSMSSDPDGTFLQKDSTRIATNVIGKFMNVIQTAVTTKIFSAEQLLVLPEANNAINDVPRGLVLAGLDPSMLTACVFIKPPLWRNSFQICFQMI